MSVQAYKRNILIALIFGGVILSTTAALAGVSWTVGRRNDASILKLTAQLEKRARGKDWLRTEPAYIILSSNIWDVNETNHHIIRNELIRVHDPEYEGVSTRELTLNSQVKLEFKQAWIQRGKKIIKLDEDIWNIIKGDDDKATEIIIAFPDVKKGDLLGWSTEEKYDFTWGGSYISMADRLPVMMCRTRIKTTGETAYRTNGEHLRKGLWSKKILKKEHGVPSDIRITVVDIPARPTGRYAPSFLEYEPYLQVTRRGRWSDEANRWFYNVSWNEQAARGSRMIDWLEDKAGYLIDDAREISLGYNTPREQADQLHRFIRDEVVTVNPFTVRSGNRTPKNVFDSRQATDREKGLLMFSMCRALGLDVTLIAGRNQFFGDIDMANPNLGLLTDFVVRVNSTPFAYYTPAFNNSPPRELPPSLRGVKALELSLIPEANDRSLQQQAFKNTGAQITLYWDEYCRLVKKKDWAKWVTLPGNANEIMATTAEALRWYPETEELSVQIQVTGFSRLQTSLQKEGDDSLQLTSYIDKRLNEAEVIEAKCKAATTRGGTSSLAGKVTMPPLPSPAGNNWIIPAESVFGKVFLHGWDADQGTPFIVRMSEDKQFTWRTSLPSGWDDAEVPPPFSLVDEQFSYHCNFKILNGDLVVSREVRLLRGMTMYSSLPEFGEVVMRVRDFERSPLVLVKKTS